MEPGSFFFFFFFTPRHRQKRTTLALKLLGIPFVSFFPPATELKKDVVCRLFSGGPNHRQNITSVLFPLFLPRFSVIQTSCCAIFFSSLSPFDPPGARPASMPRLARVPLFVTVPLHDSTLRAHCRQRGRLESTFPSLLTAGQSWCRCAHRPCLFFLVASFSRRESTTFGNGHPTPFFPLSGQRLHKPRKPPFLFSSTRLHEERQLNRHHPPLLFPPLPVVWMVGGHSPLGAVFCFVQRRRLLPSTQG